MKKSTLKQLVKTVIQEWLNHEPVYQSSTSDILIKSMGKDRGDKNVKWNHVPNKLNEIEPFEKYPRSMRRLAAQQKRPELPDCFYDEKLAQNEFNDLFKVLQITFKKLVRAILDQDAMTFQRSAHGLSVILNNISVLFQHWIKELEKPELIEIMVGDLKEITAIINDISSHINPPYKSDEPAPINLPGEEPSSFQPILAKKKIEHLFEVIKSFQNNVNRIFGKGTDELS